MVRKYFVGFDERSFEEQSDFKVTDPTASVEEKTQIAKVRKLDRSIGNNLKLLYGYRCQICGKLIGEEYILSDDRPYLSEDAAKLLLNADLNSGDYVKAVNNWAIRNGVKLNQVQFDALVSFCYNIGPSLWESDTTKFYLKSAIIAYRDGSKTVPDQIIDGFCRYHKSNGKAYKCLWFRRRNEAELFLTGDYNIDRENKFMLPTDISWS